jgi:biopolymer transport protein ExbD
MSRYGRQRHVEEDEEGADAELNLVPYLDIMMNLVIFLIFSFQVIIEFKLIDVVPPAVGQTASASATPENPKPTITLLITKEGYRLLSTSPEMAAIDIPLKGSKYDTAELHDRLVSWKKDYGLGESIVFTADLDTEYKVVVEAMDSIRNDGKELLFPDVLLARPSGVK